MSYKTITLKNGKPYTIRDNRDRFFFPGEWDRFWEQLKWMQKPTFWIMLNTGARINEVRHLKPEDCDIQNKRLILKVTKIKARKHESRPRPRIIPISSQFAKWLRKHIRENGKINFGILSTPGANLAMKRALKRAGFKDYMMFSTHNIRKTHGNWLKALGIDGTEICTRLGHDYNTFIRSYSSPDIFSAEEKLKMRDLLGDLYGK